MESEKIFWTLAILAMGGFAAFFLSGNFVAPVNAAPQGAQLQAAPANGQQETPSSAVGAGTPVVAENGVQEVTLTVQGATYYPNPIRVKKGVPVRITADLGSVRGCATSIIIPEFGISKYFRQGDNVLEFTPGKSGTFDFGCSMWMYTGKLVVEESDGTVADYSGSAPAPAGGSCGGSSGGCGCGCGGSR